MEALTTLKAHINAVEPTPIKQLYFKPQRIHYKLPGFIYYLRVEVEGRDAPLYKIGFCIDVYKRIHTLRDGLTSVKITLIACTKFNKAFQANMYEASLHKKFRNHRYSGKQVLNNGNSELYEVDVLRLDKT